MAAPRCMLAAAATVVLLAVLLQVLFKRPGLPFRHQGQQLYELVDAAGCGVCAREHSTARGCADMPTTAHARLVPANTSVQALVRTSVCTGTPTVIQKCLQSVVEPNNKCHLGACSESSRAARGLNITFMRRAFGGRAAFPQRPPPGSELPGFGPPPAQAGTHGHSAPTVNLEFYPRDDEEHQQQGGSSSSSRGEFGDVYGLRAAVREVLADYQATQGCGVAAHMAADVGGHSLALHAFQLQARGSTFSWHTDRLGGLGQFFITLSGRKRWRVAPCQDGDGLVEFESTGGDIVYFPQQWYHATQCITDTCAAALAGLDDGNETPLPEGVRAMPIHYPPQ